MYTFSQLRDRFHLTREIRHRSHPTGLRALIGSTAPPATRAVFSFVARCVAITAFGAEHAARRAPGGISKASSVARFAPSRALSSTITATAGSGGTITPSGPVSVGDGASQTFTFAGDPGYRVGDVLVDGVSLGGGGGFGSRHDYTPASTRSRKRSGT